MMLPAICGGLIYFIRLPLAGSQNVVCLVTSWQQPLWPALVEVVNAPHGGDDSPPSSYNSRELPGVCTECLYTLKE